MHGMGAKFLMQKYATLTNKINTTATAAKVSKRQQKSSIFIKKSDFLVTSNGSRCHFSDAQVRVEAFCQNSSDWSRFSPWPIRYAVSYCLRKIQNMAANVK